MDERFRVGNKLLLLQLIADQVRERDLVRIVDGQEYDPRTVVLNAEGAVEAKHAYAVLLIEPGYQIEKRVFIRCL